MCISHDPSYLKVWTPEKCFVAYKVIVRWNKSTNFVYSWSVGVHTVCVAELKSYVPGLTKKEQGVSSTGFYVFLDRKVAFRLKNHMTECKVMAVHVDPSDIVYVGYHFGDRVAVCRRVEVKSLRGLRK